MGKTKLAALAAIAALSACSKPTPARGDNAASASANAAATAAPAATASEVALNPGEWETVVETAMTGDSNDPRLPSATAMTGVPANVPPSVAANMNHKVTTRNCLTPEKAAHPGADFFGDKGRQGCTNGVTMAGGRIGGTLACRDPRGATSTMTLDGRYGGDSYEMTMKATMAQGSQSMTMTSHSVGHRVAPTCSAASKDS